MIILIVIIILSTVLFMPLKIRVLRDNYNNDVDLYIIKSLNLKIDIDTLFRIVTMDDKKSPIIVNLIKVYQSKNFIKTILNFSKIKKLTIIINNKSKTDEGKVYFEVMGWIALSYLRNIIKNNFKIVKNEYYTVRNKEKNSKILNAEIVFEIRVVYFIFSILLNIKDIPKMLKAYKKGSEKNEQPSNI